MEKELIEKFAKEYGVVYYLPKMDKYILGQPNTPAVFPIDTTDSESYVGNIYQIGKESLSNDFISFKFISIGKVRIPGGDTVGAIDINLFDILTTEYVVCVGSDDDLNGSSQFEVLYPVCTDSGDEVFVIAEELSFQVSNKFLLERCKPLDRVKMKAICNISIYE